MTSTRISDALAEEQHADSADDIRTPGGYSRPRCPRSSIELVTVPVR